MKIEIEEQEKGSKKRTEQGGVGVDVQWSSLPEVGL